MTKKNVNNTMISIAKTHNACLKNRLPNRFFRQALAFPAYFCPAFSFFSFSKR